MITKTNEGGAVIILDVYNYIKEAKRQLSDATFYKKTSENTMSKNGALVEKALKNLKQRGPLDEKLSVRLKPVNP